MSVLSKISSHKDLLVWQKGMELVKLIYSITQSFPNDEKFGLTSQIRRSAISIPSNIAEGYGRDFTKNYSHFLKISRGSLTELETQMIIAFEIGYIDKSEFDQVVSLIEEENKMLNSLIKKMTEYITNN